MAQTRLQRNASRHAVEVRRTLSRQLRDMRLDAGATQQDVARAAGLSQGYVARVEAGVVSPTLEAYSALASVLGSDFVAKIYPNTGPAIRDRHQAPIVEALIGLLHPRWRALPEVPVRAPSRGVIDLVLHEPAQPLLVATEIESELRRLEQRLRWHTEKAGGLPSSELWRAVTEAGGRSPTISRLLVVRATRANRAVVRAFEQTLAAAYPARIADTMASLTRGTAWPGPGLIWAAVEGGIAHLHDRPPRYVRLGR